MLFLIIYLRYVFETKEIKKTNTKSKKDKEGTSEEVPEHKTIAHLQVCVSSSLFAFHLPTFENSAYQLLSVNSYIITYNGSTVPEFVSHTKRTDVV